MSAVGYLRVSTDRQAERGHGLDVQRAAVRGWARAAGVRLVATYCDEGVSGSVAALPARHELAAALDELRRRRPAVLVVYRLDRLARELVLQEQLISDVHAAGCLLRSCSAAENAFLDDEPADPTRALVRQVLGAVGQYERAMIRLRMTAGRDRKRAAGGYAGGRPPLGSIAVGGELVPDPDPAVQRVLSSVRAGIAAGQGIRELARELNASHPRPGGRGWHPQTVARLVGRLPGRGQIEQRPAVAVDELAK